MLAAESRILPVSLNVSLKSYSNSHLYFNYCFTQPCIVFRNYFFLPGFFLYMCVLACLLACVIVYIQPGEKQLSSWNRYESDEGKTKGSASCGNNVYSGVRKPLRYGVVALFLTDRLYIYPKVSFHVSIT